MVSPTDTHRHLSHLIGLYPGYALSSYDSSIQAPPKGYTTYTKSQVLAATETSLIHRGNGTAADGDAGWEKVWRAASWAQLGNASQFYHELTVSTPSAINAASLIFLALSMRLNATTGQIYSACTIHWTRIPFFK